MKEKILIVEDNPQNMELVEIIRMVNSYTLLKATDREKVLDTAHERAARPHNNGYTALLSCHCGYFTRQPMQISNPR